MTPSKGHQFQLVSLRLTKNWLRLFKAPSLKKILKQQWKRQRE